MHMMIGLLRYQHSDAELLTPNNGFPSRST